MIKTDFIKLYEELSELNESKADTQKLIDFAGENLANRFLAVKNRLKMPENDLYYWINTKTVAELENRVTDIEQSQSQTQIKRDIGATGAKLVAETADWKVYYITTFEAAKKYGRDTKWCITGVDGKGDIYWKDYTNRGVQFYFYISKENYDNRGASSKYALALFAKRAEYEIYDQQDNKVSLVDVPFLKTINVPEIDFSELSPYWIPRVVECTHCGWDIYICDGESYKLANEDTEYYHTLCWYEKFEPEVVPQLTDISMRCPGKLHINTVLPYAKAATKIITELKKLTATDKQNVSLSWRYSDSKHPIKKIININNNRIEVHNNTEEATQIVDLMNN